KAKARSMGADIALYGHTHERFCAYEDGLYIMNPGSTSCPRDGRKPSFGIIDVSPSGIMTNIIDL
ncbi:MAG: metallophosphoesterase family protein, partial [Oscillospiraceae bacterium]|nr:metallophosphoesterase family protein [Oscillospiraceae bacterium]